VQRCSVTRAHLTWHSWSPDPNAVCHGHAVAVSITITSSPGAPSRCAGDGAAHGISGHRRESTGVTAAASTASAQQRAQRPPQCASGEHGMRAPSGVVRSARCYCAEPERKGQVGEREMSAKRAARDGRARWPREMATHLANIARSHLRGRAARSPLARSCTRFSPAHLWRE
jgi:hypothetical protein